MNRQQWKAQKYGSHVNYMALTWGEDQRRKREQERRAAIRQIVAVVFVLIVIVLSILGIK